MVEKTIEGVDSFVDDLEIEIPSISSDSFTVSEDLDSEVENQEKKVEEKDFYVKKESKPEVLGKSSKEAKEEKKQSEEEDSYSIIPLARAWFESEGWNWDDRLLEEDSLKGFTNLLRKIIDKNVRTVFASEEVERFNEYVKNGGDPYKWFTEVYNPDYDSLDKYNIKNSAHQRIILEIFFKETTSFDKREIGDIIDIFSSSGKLESEAVKALEKLKSIRENKAREIEERQKEELKRREKDLEQYILNIKNTVSSFDFIAGIKVSEEDKKNFLSYILKTDKDGKTKYEKDLISDLNAALKTAYMMYKRMYDLKPTESLKSVAAKEVFESLGNLGKKKPSSKKSSFDLDEILESL